MPECYYQSLLTLPWELKVEQHNRLDTIQDSWSGNLCLKKEQRGAASDTDRKFFQTQDHYQDIVLQKQTSQSLPQQRISSCQAGIAETLRTRFSASSRFDLEQAPSCFRSRYAWRRTKLLLTRSVGVRSMRRLNGRHDFVDWWRHPNGISTNLCYKYGNSTNRMPLQPKSLLRLYITYTNSSPCARDKAETKLAVEPSFSEFWCNDSA